MFFAIDGACKYGLQQLFLLALIPIYDEGLSEMQQTRKLVLQTNKEQTPAE
jgi:hypothetical protein